MLNHKFPELSSVVPKILLFERPMFVLIVKKDFPSYFVTPLPYVPNQRLPFESLDIFTIPKFAKLFGMVYLLNVFPLKQLYVLGK